MRAIEFPEVNEVYAKDQPQYNPLPVFKRERDPNGMVVSKWQLSDEELRTQAPPNWNIQGFIDLCRKPYRERLVIAASLLVAEIDRFDVGGMELLNKFSKGE